MLNSIISLAQYGFYGGGSIGNVLAQWEAAGVFSYLLPFLLIFALIFVTLSNIKLFSMNKGVNAVIALAVALMSLQFDFVSLFFAELFPRFGIALGIILVLIIVGGFFFDSENKGFKWLFVILGLVIAGVVIIKSLYYFGLYTGGQTWFNVYWPNVLIAAIIIGAIIAVIASQSPSTKIPNVSLPVYEK